MNAVSRVPRPSLLSKCLLSKHLLRTAGAALLGALLSSCAMVATQGVSSLDFQAAPDRFSLDPGALLTDQRVPAWQLVGVREALRRAPPGSVILTCWKGASLTNFWGPCSHISRKFGADTVAETLNFTSGGTGVFPVSQLYDRYAVIVLDAGVRPQHMAALRAEIARTGGKPYGFGNHPNTYYCSTYQNALQRAMGLPDVVPFNHRWSVYLPADVLLQKNVRVLWVGVRGMGEAAAASAANRP